MAKNRVVFIRDDSTGERMTPPSLIEMDPDKFGVNDSDFEGENRPAHPDAPLFDDRDPALIAQEANAERFRRIFQLGMLP